MTRRKSFWHRYVQQRITRRRALQLAAMSGGGLVLAAACGGGGGEEEQPEGTGTPSAQGGPGEVINPQENKNIPPGGTYRTAIPTGPYGLDPQQNLSFTTESYVSGYVYSRLYKFKTDPGFETTLYEAVPDIAESHEVTDDGMTWTFTLRPGIKFHNKSPLNGRELDSEDVVKTFERFIGKTDAPGARYQMVLERTVDSVEAPDANTVVFHLKFPYAPFLTQIASASYLWILSKEAATGDIDPALAENVIGTGPWVLDEYEPDVVLRYSKNPEWYGAPLPYCDANTLQIVPEYATRLAQMRAGNLDATAPNFADVASLVSDIPGAQVLPGNPYNILNFMFFDFNVNPDSPFKDPNVRRAVSMSIDRDGLLEALYDLRAVRDQGYNIEARWHNALPAGLSRYWLDPKSEEMGDAGKWYEYNPTEAKALLEQAGYPDGFSTELHRVEGVYGQTFDDGGEAVVPMVNAVGVKAQSIVDDYGSYISDIFYKGNLTGMAYALETVFADPDEYLFAMYHPDGPRNHSHIDDPDLTQMIEDQATETDLDERVRKVQDIEKYVSDKMYYVPLVVYGVGAIGVYHPWVLNVGVWGLASFAGGTETSLYLGLAEDAPGRT